MVIYLLMFVISFCCVFFFFLLTLFSIKAAFITDSSCLFGTYKCQWFYPWQGRECEISIELKQYPSQSNFAELILPSTPPSKEEQLGKPDSGLKFWVGPMCESMMGTALPRGSNSEMLVCVSLIFLFRIFLPFCFSL